MTGLLAACQLQFAREGYYQMPALIATVDLLNLRKHHRMLVAGGVMRFGDSQSSRRWVLHNERVARLLQHMITPVMSSIADVEVKPSYTYTASYEEGAELPRHVDRAQCQYSVSICIDFEPEPDGPTQWPLWLETRVGPVPIYQALGDGLFYKGCELEHYRTRLPPGCRSTSVFLHYVDTTFSGSID